MRRGLALAIAALAAACGKSGSDVGARISGPSSVAAFRGVTAKAPGVRPYLAVAATRGDELRLLDLDDHKPVLAPVQFAPLSVPTGARPARVRAAALHDGADRADALVVVPGGTAELQLVETWTATNRVRPGDAVDLAPLLPAGSSGEILALETMPVVAAPGDPPAPGAARILASLAGGFLVSVPVTRGPAPDFRVLLGAPELHDLGFDVTSMSIGPDLVHVYASSPDPIAGVLGAAEIDTRDWSVQALDALAPTTAVAAFDVAERLAGATNPDDLDPTPHLRVYAALDPTACGPGRAISCGIAVLDPATRALLPDPAGELPYAAPIPVPGIPVAMAISGPPANGDAATKRLEDTVAVLVIAPRSGQTVTAALGVVPTSEGGAYWLDLTRWRTPNDASALRPRSTATPAGVAVTTSSSNAGVDPATNVVGATIGVCAPDAIPPDPVPAPGPPPSCAWVKGKPSTDATLPSYDSTLVRARMWVTPGYTLSESWTLAYQGALPQLELRRALVGRLVDGRLWVAVQVPNAADAPAGAPPFLAVARVYDPTLGVHSLATHGEGDLVDVKLETAVCRDPARAANAPDFTATATDLLAPDPASFPGGAIALAEPFVAPADPPYSSCPAIAAGAPPVPALVAVRAAALVLRGTNVGYAGRPAFGQLFELVHQDEAPLAAACTLLPWQATPPACDTACRAACESLVLARKARRIYYLADRCPDPEVPVDITGHDPCVRAGFAPGRGTNDIVTVPAGDPQPLRDPRFLYPHPRGPAIAFQVAVTPTNPSAETPDFTVWPGSALFFTTTTGMTPAGRRPLSNGAAFGAAMPTDVVTFDRSTIPGRDTEGVRFYVSYGGDEVLVFSPAAGVNDVGLLR